MTSVTQQQQMDPSTHLLSSSPPLSSSWANTLNSPSTTTGVRFRSPVTAAATGTAATATGTGAGTATLTDYHDGATTDDINTRNNKNNPSNGGTTIPSSLSSSSSMSGVSPYKKWLILVLASFVLFGTYFGYDNPSALNTQLQSYLNQDYDTWQYQFNVLYSVYSLPNIILPFIGGWLHDRMGNAVTLITFSAFVCVGQAFFALGIQTRSFWMMVMGRIIFGIGGESLSVVQSAVVGQWWADGKLGFALGVLLSVARLGSVANDSVTPMVASAINVPMAAWFGFLMCAASMLSSVALAIMARNPPAVTLTPTHASTNKNTDTVSPISSSKASAIIHGDDSDHNDQMQHDDTVNGRGHDHDHHEDIMIRPLIHDTNHHMDIPSTNNIKGIGNESLATSSDSSGITEVELPSKLSDIRLFTLPFWLLCGICICLYGTVVPWHSVASDLLQDRWYHGDAQRAGVMLGIPDTISAVSSPFFGLAVDYWGRRGSSMMVCSLILASVHATFGLTSFTPIPALVLLGLGYAIYAAAIWPSVAFLAPRGRLGMAYGLSTAALNLSLTIFPLVVAWLRSWYHWVGVELFFASLACVACVLCGVLIQVDHRRYDSMLDSPAPRAVALRKSAIASRLL